MNKKLLSLAFVFSSFMILGVANVNASTITDNALKEIAPDMHNATFKTVKPKNLNEANFIISGYVNNVINLEGYMINADCNEPGYTSCSVQFQSDDYQSHWDIESQTNIVDQGELVSYNINVTYDEPSQSKVNHVKEYIDKLSTATMEDLNTWYKVEDLSLINYYLTSSNSELWRHGSSGRALKYAPQLNKILGGSGISYYINVLAGSQDESLMYESAYGPMTIYYKGYCYGVTENGIYLRRVLYIPEATQNTTNAYVAAAQKRINDYLGNNDVTVSYGGTLASLPDGAEDESITGLSDYYNIEVNERTYKFYIIKGNSSNLVSPKYNGKNIDSNIAISSTSVIPLDTDLTTDVVVSDEIKNALGTSDYKAFDIKLHSNAANKAITTLTNGKFLVSIPVPSELEGKKIVAIYVNEAGEKEKHAVTVKNNMATFETDHFSVYALTENNEITNPKTSDGVLFSFGVCIVSLIGITCTCLYVKKHN